MGLFIKKNIDVEFHEVSGEILESSKSSQNHLSLNGGGGYIGRFGGVINAPKLNSSRIIYQDFWIKTEDGTEKNIELIDHNIPLRKGQKVTLISASKKGNNTHFYCNIINHSTKKNSVIHNVDDIYYYMGFKNISVIPSYILAMFLYFIGYNFVGGGNAGIQCGAVLSAFYAGYIFFVKLPKIRKIKISLANQIEYLVNIFGEK